MYCSACGKQIADEVLFCPYCGTPTLQGDELTRLVPAARGGDQNAISALYEKTYSKVYYTVKSMIKDEDAVLDIVQDAYIKAFAHLERFQGDTKFLPWVRQIAANTARDWLKRKRPMLFAELGSGNEQDTPVEELLPDERSENLPEQVIDQKETTRLIREIIEDLPEDQRAAIGMFYYEEMSVKEIAAAMGVSESAVKSRLLYGRNKIEKKVLELEKQGTKLYSLAPIPFLLLLFRSQEVHAAEAPSSQILHTILASQPIGAAPAAGVAQGTGTASAVAGGAQGTGTASAVAGAEATATGAVAAAGTAAATSGIGALKIGLIVLASMAVINLGALGAILIASHSSKTQEVAVIEEDDIDQEESKIPEETEASEETETLEEADPIDEALEQYRTIIGQADSYDYGSFAEADMPWFEFAGYQYALVQMQPVLPVPTLLLGKEIIDTQLNNVPSTLALVFQYDPDTKTIHQSTETVADGGIRGGLSVSADGNGLLRRDWSSGTGEASTTRITLDGDSLNWDIIWSGQIFDEHDSFASVAIEWHEIGDLSALDSWTAPDLSETVLSESVNEDTLPTDGDRIVLTGTVGTYNYDEIVVLQRQPGLNAEYYSEASWERIQNTTYHVIVLDTPQTLYLHSGGGDGYFSNEALMINLYYVDDMDQYEGQHITFSIDPDNSWWPSDMSLPIDQPFSGDIHVLD